MRRMQLIANELLCKLIVVRHGTPDYSDHRNPLTDDGINEMHHTGSNIRESLRGIRNVEIRSSPSPRAIASAEIIRKFLGRRGKITIYPELGSVRGKNSDGVTHDPEHDEEIRQAIQAKFRRLGPVAFDREYYENPQWQSGVNESGRFFESHDESIRRMDDIYRQIAFNAERPPTPKAIIIVGHIELLGWRIHQIFKINPSTAVPLRRGEFAEILFMRSNLENYHEVIARFRDRTIKGLRLSFADELEILPHDPNSVG